MFTGLIEEIGEVISIVEGENFVSLGIKANKVMEDISLGDSISTNGVCLTVSKVKNNFFLSRCYARNVTKN